MIGRATTMDGTDAAAVSRRELRAAEVRAHVRSLDDMNRVQFLTVLSGESKEASFDALVAIANAPIPIRLPGESLNKLARGWFERWESGRTAAISDLEAAAQKLRAAVTHARRGLGRRVGRPEPELV